MPHIIPILDFPLEILENVLQQIEPKRPLKGLEKRDCLSVESFASVLPQIVAQEECTRIPERPGRPGQPCGKDCCAVRRWRLVCKKFSQLGLDRQFKRVIIQFSSDGFKKLRFIDGNSSLAVQVEQFSYMIRPFYYQEEAWFSNLQREFRHAIVTSPKSQRFRFRDGDLDYIKSIKDRAAEQKLIIDGRVDFQTLLQAFTNFQKLKQIRLMKVVDPLDSRWAGLLRRNPLEDDRYGTELGAPRWHYAFERAAEALSVAVDQSNSPVHRFSSKFLDPPTPVILPHNLAAITARIARRLRSLEVQIVDNDRNLDEKTLELSDLFNVVFKELVNLECLHIGFGRPVTIPLETVFHKITFKNLSHIGVHLWVTTSQDLIDLLKRHQTTLRSLRLRYVQLRQATEEHPGTWKDVLEFMRRDLNLKWASLRNIGYGGDVQAMMGMHPVLTHGQLDMLNDTDSDLFDISVSSGEDQRNELDAVEPADFGNPGNPESQEHEGDSDGSENEHGFEGADINEGTASESPEDSFDDGPVEEEEHDSDIEDDDIIYNDVLTQQSVETSENATAEAALPLSSTPGFPCECETGYGWETLGDNGTFVDRPRWIRWQKWVVKRCRTHDPT